MEEEPVQHSPPWSSLPPPHGPLLRYQLMHRQTDRRVQIKFNTGFWIFVSWYNPMKTPFVAAWTILTDPLIISSIYPAVIQVYWRTLSIRLLLIVSVVFSNGPTWTYSAGWTSGTAGLWWCHRAPSGPSVSQLPSCIQLALSECEARWALGWPGRWSQ